MKYIISGDSKVLDNVIREQRIRVARGQVKVSPATDFSELEVKLQAITKERDDLMSENKDLKLKIAEIESVSDTKELQEDTKDVSVVDSKGIQQDEKSVGKSDMKKPQNKTKE